MDINKCIIIMILIFMCVGAVDRILLHGKLGYGAKFEEGIMTMGSLALAMLGIMCAAPVLGSILAPLISPVYTLIGADPAMFAGSLLATDMGGYSLALAMTEDSRIWQLSGVYLSTMMGTTIVFTIPVSLGIIRNEDKPYLTKGILAGLIAIPFGVAVSGILSGLSLMFIVRNLIPSVVLSIALSIGLWKAPGKTMYAFNLFAGGINSLVIICLADAIIQEIGGITIIPGMEPIGPHIQEIGIIALTLAGAYPMVYFISTVFAKPLKRIGRLIEADDNAVAAMLACLANNIPLFTMLKDMSPESKVVAVSFSVCASFAFGDHLGYVSGIDTSIIAPMIAGKLCGGLLAVCIAKLMMQSK